MSCAIREGRRKVIKWSFDVLWSPGEEGESTVLPCLFPQIPGSRIWRVCVLRQGGCCGGCETWELFHHLCSVDGNSDPSTLFFSPQYFIENTWQGIATWTRKWKLLTLRCSSSTSNNTEDALGPRACTSPSYILRVWNIPLIPCVGGQGPVCWASGRGGTLKKWGLVETPQVTEGECWRGLGPPKCFLSLLLCTPMCFCLATLSFHRPKSISLSSMDRNVHNSDYEKLFLFISYFILGTFVIVTESSLTHHLKHFINTLCTFTQNSIDSHKTEKKNHFMPIMKQKERSHLGEKLDFPVQVFACNCRGSIYSRHICDSYRGRLTRGCHVRAPGTYGSTTVGPLLPWNDILSSVWSTKLCSHVTWRKVPGSKRH